VLALIVGMPWVLYQVWAFVSPGLYAAERRFVYFLIPLSGVLTAASVAFLYFILLPISLYFLITFGTGIASSAPPAQMTAPLPEGIVLPEIPVLDGEPIDPDPGQSWVNRRLKELRIHVGEGRTLGMPLRGDGLIAQEYRIGEYINLIFALGLGLAVAFQLPLVLMLLSWVGILDASDIKPYRKHVAFGCAVAGAILTPQDPWSMVLLAGALYLLFEFGVVLMRFVPARAVARGSLRESDRTDEPRDEQ